ncbi:MAG: hypothetical protein ACR2NM_17165 [Bythopirellula sp.]
MTRFTNISLVVLSTAFIASCADSKKSAKPNAVEPPAAPAAAAADVEIAPPDTETALEVAETPRRPQRILLLARGGPLIVDVWLTIDDRPHDEGIKKIVEQVLAAGDTDGNGRSTWVEWSENQEFLHSELVSLGSTPKRRVRNWIERYDENEDGQMQYPEAAAWLGRDGGRSAKAFTVRSSRSYLAMASTGSRLWHILDADDDGQLSRDELAQVSQRLFLLDTNDDQIVDTSELATLRDQLTDSTMQRSSLTGRSKRPAAIHLSNRAATGSLDYVLSDLYAPRQQLGAGSFSARRELFVRLDQDEDRSLSSSELEGILEITPHLKMSLEFSTDEESGQLETQLKMIEHSAEFEGVVQPSPHRLVLSTADTRLTISAHDLSSSIAESQTVQQNQIRLMVHDRGDSLFEALDANSNGTLGEREIFVAATQIAEFDANRDGQVAADELSYSMTVAFLRSESPGEMSFYVPNFDDPLPTANDTPAWFSHADLNSDGDVSRYEFLSTAEHFTALDTNNDGFISANEASTGTTP